MRPQGYCVLHYLTTPVQHPRHGYLGRLGQVPALQGRGSGGGGGVVPPVVRDMEDAVGSHVMAMYKGHGRPQGRAVGLVWLGRFVNAAAAQDEENPVDDW